MSSVYLNAISTAVPEHDVHTRFLQYCPRLLPDPRSRKLFARMASRAQIDHRYSFLEPLPEDDQLDRQGFYRAGDFPDTRRRMVFYEQHAFALASFALDKLDLSATTHLIITSCTGFYAPGLDHEIIQHYKLSPTTERNMLGFMGCHAAINGLKLARHIVRSDHRARVLMVNLELCTLHLQAEPTLEEALSFMIFADGCAASLISAEPSGLELESFSSTVLAEAAEQITWRIGESGFDMNLSGQVPATIAANLPLQLSNILSGCTASDIVHWAVHPGGRSVLDAVQEGASLESGQLHKSREVLRRYGNMSSATIMFVLKDILDSGSEGPGCAMAFGPGLSVESMRFRWASKGGLEATAGG